MTRRQRLFLTRWLLGVALVLGCLSTAATCLAQAEDIVLTVGGSTVISANSVVRVATSAPDVADVTVATPSEVLVNGKKPGSATLYVWDKAGRTTYPVSVRSDNGGMAREIAQAIGDSGISVKVINKTVVLSGSTSSSASSQRSEKVARAFGLEVVNVLTVSEGAAGGERGFEIQRALGLPQVTVSCVGSGVVLGGSVETQMDKARAERIAGLFSDKVLSLLEVRNPVSVEIEVKIVEVNKGALSRFGIEFGSYSGGVMTPGTFTITDAQVKAMFAASALPGVSAKLDAQTTDSWMKTLANPRLVTRAGEKAGIHIGGEFPVVMAVDGSKVTVEWKPFGIKLDIEPTVSTDLASVSVKVQPEVSSLDWTNSVKFGGIVLPSLKIRKASTDVTMAEGSTLVMGGLIQNDDTKAVTKLPLLGDIPVLGALFRSKGYQRGETELVIFVTPRVIRAKASPQAPAPASTPPPKTSAPLAIGGPSTEAVALLRGLLVVR